LGNSNYHSVSTIVISITIPTKSSILVTRTLSEYLKLLSYIDKCDNYPYNF